MENEPAPGLAARIDALLPQTQCTRCGYAGCLPYAEAVASGAADINQCPPGGDAIIMALAALLERPAKALIPAHGVESPPKIAWIDESRCIGCARCIAPCPVDAIVGAAKYMHTVLADRCTGCELCLPPCPVDCIEMKAAPQAPPHQAALNRMRFAAHEARSLRRKLDRRRELDAKKAAVLGSAAPR